MATNSINLARKEMYKRVGSEITSILIKGNEINSVEKLNSNGYEITYNNSFNTFIQIKEMEYIFADEEKSDTNNEIFGLFEAEEENPNVLNRTFRNWDEANKWLGRHNYHTDESYDEEGGYNFWYCSNPSYDKSYVLKEIEFEKVV